MRKKPALKKNVQKKTSTIRKRKIPLSGNLKSKVDNEIRIKRLNALDDEVFTSTSDDIRAGRVSRDILLSFCGTVGRQMKNDASYKNPDGIYVAEALIKASNGTNIANAFGFRKGSKNKSLRIEEIQIAYHVWQKINIFGIKMISAIYSAAELFDKTTDNVSRIYYKYKNEIDEKYQGIEERILQ
jgi:hypothetical protein